VERRTGGGRTQRKGIEWVEPGPGTWRRSASGLVGWLVGGRADGRSLCPVTRGIDECSFLSTLMSTYLCRYVGRRGKTQVVCTYLGRYVCQQPVPVPVPASPGQAGESSPFINQHMYCRYIVHTEYINAQMSPLHPSIDRISLSTTHVSVSYCNFLIYGYITECRVHTTFHLAAVCSKCHRLPHRTHPPAFFPTSCSCLMPLPPGWRLT